MFISSGGKAMKSSIEENLEDLDICRVSAAEVLGEVGGNFRTLFWSLLSFFWGGRRKGEQMCIFVLCFYFLMSHYSPFLSAPCESLHELRIILS